MINNDYSVDVYNSDELFNLIKDKWINFENDINHSNITMSYDWLHIWWDIFKSRDEKKMGNFGHSKKLLVILLYKNKKLISIIPLIKLYRRKFFVDISYIEFLGQQWAGIFSDFISKGLSNQDFLFFVDWLYKNEKFDILNLSYIPNFTPNFNLNDSAMTCFSACPTLNLHEYEDFNAFCEKNYSKHLKQNFRTSFNNMKKECLYYCSTVENVSDSNFDEIIRLSKMKLIDNKQTLYADIDKLYFFKKICQTFKSDILFIKLNGINVAYRLNLYFNKNKYCLDASYDRNFKKFELGSLSVHENIKDSFIKRIDEHCEGTGIDFYKLKFISNIYKVYTYSKPGNSLFSNFIFKRHNNILMKYQYNFSIQLSERLK